jgi:DNA-binding transcriptional LysR family regulator
MKASSLDRMRVLEALLRTRSAKSAAAELGVARSTTTKTLGLLRSELSDQLLQRRGGRLHLTPRAERLVDPLGEALSALDRLLEDRGTQVGRACTAIAMRDEFVLALAPELVTRLAAERPQTTLKFLTYQHQTLSDDLARRTVDIAVAVHPPRSAELATTLLYREPYVCITADPMPLTLERYLSTAHVTTTSHLPNTGVDLVLAQNGYKRRIAAQVPHLAALFEVVESEGLCATLPVRVMRALRPSALFIQPPPIAIPPRRVMLVWHREYEQDPDNRWLRGLLMSVSKRQASTRGRIV